MNLPETLKIEVAASIGEQVIKVTQVGGGDISQAARVDLADGRKALVKWQPTAASGLFIAERRGLDRLRAAGALRVPQVLAQAEATTDLPAFIVLEWLDSGSKSSSSAELLGTDLAVLHRVTAASFGLDHDNFIGANPQSNRPTGDWVTFFREQRLGFQMKLAQRNGLLPAERARRLESLLNRLSDWLPAQPPASLLHGDLWGGNWLATTSGEPVLIDPAIYYGHRETDLAFSGLFGGFPPTFYAAYQAAWPLDSGYAERKDLYNLYHLLNHLNLFGEGYGGSVDSILRRYVG
jgi:fructosamine-3-kinase